MSKLFAILLQLVSSQELYTVHASALCSLMVEVLFTICSLLVSDPVSDSMLQPLKHLLSSSDDDVLKAASLALSNFALYGSG